jgi:hypothetical protein
MRSLLATSRYCAPSNCRLSQWSLIRRLTRSRQGSCASCALIAARSSATSLNVYGRSSDMHTLCQNSVAQLLGSAFGSAHDHVDLAATTLRTDESLAPPEHRCRGAVPIGELGRSGSIWWRQAQRHTMRRTPAAAAPASVIDGPGSDFTGAASGPPRRHGADRGVSRQKMARRRQTSARASPGSLPGCGPAGITDRDRR